MKHYLFLILPILLLLSFGACSDDENPSEEVVEVPYPKSVLDTKYYGLTGKVKTAERIRYSYSDLSWDSLLNKVIKGNPSSKDVYEFDQNGVLSSQTHYNVNYEYDNTKGEYNYRYYIQSKESYEYDSKYRVLGYTYENYIIFGEEISYVNKVITTYDDINKIADRIVYRGQPLNMELPYKEVYQLDDNGYIDKDKPMEYYRSVYQQKSVSDELSSKNENKDIEKKDSKGNWVERYTVSTRTYPSGNQYNYIDNYEEQNITYYGSPASGIIREETVKDIYNPYDALNYKSSKRGLNGKIESVVENYYSNSSNRFSFVSWDWQTDKLTKNTPSSKYVESYDQNNIAIKFESIQTYYDYYVEKTFNYVNSRNIEYDAKFRVTVLNTANNNYWSNTDTIIQRTKKVITYDDVNKKATIVTYYAENDEEFKRSSSYAVYKLDSDGHIDRSYWETFESKEKKAAVIDFEPNPSFRYEPRTKYDSQNNLIESYTVAKELDKTGEVVGGYVNDLFERTITYRK